MDARTARTWWLVAGLPALVGWLALSTGAYGQDLPLGPPSEHRVEVFYTGLTGGFASSRVDFGELKPLFLPETQRDFAVGGFVSDNVFRNGDFLLYTDAGPLTLDDFQAFFAAGPITLTPEGRAPLMSSDYAFVLPMVRGSRTTPQWPVDWLVAALHKGSGFADVHHATALRYRLSNTEGVHLELVSPSDAKPTAALWEDPTAWEMLPAGTVALKRGTAESMLMAVGRPLGDGLRRAYLLAQMRRQARGATLSIDCGNMLDPGFTQLSRDERAFSFLRLSSLGYDALVPAETELSLPEADWQRLCGLVPLIAANLTPRDKRRQALPHHLIRLIDGLKVAVIGLVDDHALELTGITGPESVWKAGDPLAVARAEVEALAPENPDMVLIATNVRDARLAAMRQLTGVTAVLGDFDGLPGDIFTEQADVTGRPRTRSLQTYMVAKSSPNRVGRFTGIFDQRPGGRPELVRLRNEAHLVTDTLEEDAAWRWQLNVALDRFQSARRGLLLPDLRDVAKAEPTADLGATDALPALDTERWSVLVANILREASGAEVAVTRRLPVDRTLIGPISRLAVENWLNVGDHVVGVYMRGKDLEALAQADTPARLLTFSGYDPAAKKLMGRDVDEDELYRVTTTDAVLHHARFDDVFGKLTLGDRWKITPDARLGPLPPGDAVLLRELVLAALQGLETRHGETFTPGYMKEYARLLQPAGSEVEPRWVAALEDGQILFNGYRNEDAAPYSQVLNTRVTTPNSFAAGGKGKFTVTYDSRDWAWVNAVKAVYKRTTLETDGTPVSQKADDEIDLTSELRLAFLHPEVLDPIKPTPFLNATYITQFQPDDPVAGVTKPRRSELNARGGLVIFPGFGFKELRAGGVLQDDFTKPGYLDPGYQLAASFERKLKDVPLTLDASIDATHFFTTATDGPDRLGWEIESIGSVSIPVWQRFTLNLGADYFLYQGKVPSTLAWGSSLDFKIGLGYSLAFKPLYGVWF